MKISFKSYPLVQSNRYPEQIRIVSFPFFHINFIKLQVLFCISMAAFFNDRGYLTAGEVGLCAAYLLSVSLRAY